jgi:hypothetical protein
MTVGLSWNFWGTTSDYHYGLHARVKSRWEGSSESCRCIVSKGALCRYFRNTLTWNIDGYWKTVDNGAIEKLNFAAL